MLQWNIWIIDKNDAAIFQLQWKIENISDMFLQYSVLCEKYNVCGACLFVII